MQTVCFKLPCRLCEEPLFYEIFQKKKNTLNIHKKGKAFICLSVCYFRCHKWRHYWISSQFCMTEETGTSQTGVPEQSLIRFNLIIAPTYSLSQGSAAAGEEHRAQWQSSPWSCLTAAVKSVHFFFIALLFGRVIFWIPLSVLPFSALLVVRGLHREALGFPCFNSPAVYEWVLKIDRAPTTLFSVVTAGVEGRSSGEAAIDLPQKGFLAFRTLQSM